MSTYEPYNYQKYAEEFIVDHDEAGLFLDMSLGKTVITLTAIKKLAWDIGRVLVIAPKRPGLDTWPGEIEKWDHLRDLDLAIAIGTAAERRAALKRKAFITVINRENVVWLVNELKKDPWPFDCVVIDELTSFKSSRSQRFRALKRMRPYIKRVIGLTGTPSSNGYMDLWAESFILDGGKALGKTITGYRDQYFTPGRRNGMIVYDWNLREGAKEKILERLSSFCVTMRSEDYLDLPDFTTHVYPVRLSKKPMEKYEQMERDLLLEISGAEVDAVNAAALTTKLLQISSGAVYGSDGAVVWLHDEKLDALDEIIESAAGENVIIFYAYRHELERLKERYPEAVDVKDRGAIGRWKAGKIPILLAHPASAGHGLNLQSGGHISIWFGLTTNLEYYQQANKRLHRLGQEKPVVNYVLLSKGTYDEAVYYKILMAKEKEQNAVIAALKARIEEVQNEDHANG